MAKQTEEKDKAPGAVNEDPQPENVKVKIPAQKTLSEVVSEIVKSCMEDPKQLPQGYRDLEMWYNAQPLEGRVALVSRVRMEVERAKLTTEALFGHFKMISQRDL